MASSSVREGLGSPPNTTRKREFIAKWKWSVDRKLRKGNIMGKRDSGYSNQTEFLLKAGQCD